MSDENKKSAIYKVLWQALDSTGTFGAGARAQNAMEGLDKAGYVVIKRQDVLDLAATCDAMAATQTPPVVRAEGMAALLRKLVPEGSL